MMKTLSTEAVTVLERSASTTVSVPLAAMTALVSVMPAAAESASPTVMSGMSLLPVMVIVTI